MLQDMVIRPGTIAGSGVIGIAEGNSNAIPFTINRVYYSYGAEKGTIRGFHAHKKLQQILICVYGKLEIELDDGIGNLRKEVLSSPEKGLYVGPSTWRTIKWLEDNSVLLVLASEHYDEADYIRDYDVFKKWVSDKENLK